MGQSLVPEPPDKMTGVIFEVSTILNSVLDDLLLAETR